MLRPRIIPVLLIHQGGVVKTRQFADHKYVGDPLNAVKIFNEKEVDELIVADIDATVSARPPNVALIRRLAAECRMPLCYSGGVSTAEQFEELVSLGVEKIAVGAAAVKRPQLIREAADRVGSQSVVAVMDVRRTGWRKTYEVCTHNGKVRTGRSPDDFAREMERLGVGELLVNSIDRDGEGGGYDLDLVQSIRSCTNLPLSILGGAGSLTDLETLVERFGIIGAAAGTIFVLKGKYRAVLLQYPDRTEKDRIGHRITRAMA